MQQIETDKKLERILRKYEGNITGPNDLTGGDPPSKLFYILADRMSYLLDNKPESIITEKGLAFRRKAHFIIKTLGPHFLANPQIIENRNFLRNPDAANIQPDPGIIIPDTPVIWTSNHGFKDDVLATVLAALRHAYILFGSLPQFYNTFDGVSSWLNGVVMINRKCTTSKKTSITKGVHVIHMGTDLIIFPEGVWNKSPNSLIIDLWPGIYRIACETGTPVVPIAHYIRDYNNELETNPIHTVIDDPIRIDNLSEKAAMNYLRDILATWHYLMMEVYGKTTREELIGDNASSCIVWEQQLRKRIKTADRYDTEIELCADYRPDVNNRPENVWKPIAEAESLNSIVSYAQQLIEIAAANDFQRRF